MQMRPGGPAGIADVPQQVSWLTIWPSSTLKSSMCIDRLDLAAVVDHQHVSAYDLLGRAARTAIGRSVNIRTAAVAQVQPGVVKAAGEPT